MTKENDTLIKLVTVYSSMNQLDVGMVRGYLESHEIKTYIRDEFSGSRFFHSPAVGGIKVQVAEEDAQAAMDHIQSVDMNKTSTPSKARSLAKVFVWGYLILSGAAFVYAIVQLTLRFFS